VPGGRLFAGTVAQHRLAARDEHPLDVKPRQRVQRRQEALLVPGAARPELALPRSEIDALGASCMA
jgi:hypothetical protein